MPDQMANSQPLMESLLQFLGRIWSFVGVNHNQIVALSAMLATLLAYGGLQTWRRQLIGSSEYALAKKLLLAVYRVREAFLRVRNPFMWPSEYPEHARDSWVTQSKPELKAEALEYAYNHRLEYLTESFVELEAINLEAQVEWGTDYAKAIIPLRRCRAELMMAINDVVEAHRLRPTKRDDEAARERDDKLVLYSVPDSPHDRFTPEINAAVNEFEERLRSKIGRGRRRLGKMLRNRRS